MTGPRVAALEAEAEADLAWVDWTPERAERYRNMMRDSTAYKLAELWDAMETLIREIPGPVGLLIRRICL